MVRIADAVEECRRILSGSTDDAGFEVSVLAQEVLEMDRLKLRVHCDDEISNEQYTSLISFAKRRAGGEPSAYIIGHREFMSLDFEVNPDVLIPRPDTEILVEEVIGKYAGSKVRVLDICTGSGAIACSLAHYMNEAVVVGLDISNAALEVASSNARRTSTSDRVSFLCADALNMPGSLGEFDVVVSNPPYIETATITSLSRTVRDFEPMLALDGGADGLTFYKKIVSDIDRFLKKGGELYFEIGYNQADAVCEIMREKFSGINVIKDLAGNNRVVCGQLV